MLQKKKIHIIGDNRNNATGYYRRRAKEYEEIYYRDDPVRQKEQKKIAQGLKAVLNGRDVVEVACGTGYWTQLVSETAKTITATDIAAEMLKIAKTKIYKCPIKFSIEDAYNFSFSDKSFSGGLANFWFSHVPKAKIEHFLNEFHRCLKKKSVVFIADNVYMEGLGGKLIKKVGDENTYKLRLLKDGTQALVLKNYYSTDELLKIFSKYSKSFNKRNIFYGTCFWYLTYELY